MSTPVLNKPSLFQSGQIVPFSHTYEMVGATDYLGKRKIRVYLKNNDRFPTHEGREVCWHMDITEIESSSHDKQANVHFPNATSRV